MSKRMLNLFRNRKGSSAIEFALLAPLMALMFVGVSDFARGLARKFQVEQASYRALELISVGSIQSDYAYVAPEAAAAAGVPEGNVTVTNWLECNGMKKAQFSEVCPDGQETARFVKVQIFADFRPSFSYGPLTKGFAQPDGSVRLTSRSTLRVQ